MGSEGISEGFVFMAVGEKDFHGIGHSGYGVFVESICDYDDEG